MRSNRSTLQKRAPQASEPRQLMIPLEMASTAILTAPERAKAISCLVSVFMLAANANAGETDNGER